MSNFIKVNDAGQVVGFVENGVLVEGFVAYNGDIPDRVFDYFLIGDVLRQPPSVAHEWDVKKSAWVLNATKQKSLIVDQIAAAKAEKIVEIGDVAQAFIDSIAKDTAPDFERQTYPAQQDDALAWLADPTAKTPTLDAIAKTRGVPVDILRKKAADKVVAYRALSASVVGQRQAFEDKVNAAKTLADVEAIVPTYKAAS